MRHQLKLRETFAEPVLNGEKNFEVRYNCDRGFQKGDLVQFYVVNDEMIYKWHSIEEKLYEITYVLSGVGLRPEYVVFGIREVPSDEKGIT